MMQRFVVGDCVRVPDGSGAYGSRVHTMSVWCASSISGVGAA